MNRFVYGKIIIWFLVLSAGCQSSNDHQTVTTLESQTIPVTKLEPPQAVAVTTLEVTSSATTTTTVVQQALSDLKAQQTSQGIKVVLPENILFDFDKYNIRPSAKSALEKLNVLLQNYNQAPVLISGYTDAKGSVAYNLTLSENRANSVKNYLVQNFSVDANRLKTHGFGKSNPVAPNTNADGTDNPAGRQKNRRVEVMIQNQS